MENSHTAYQPVSIQSSQNFEVNNCEFSYKLMKRLPKYHAVVAREDPHRFLKEFHVVCLTFKLAKVPEEWVKFKAFPFSLMDTTKDLMYYKIYSTSFTTWTEMQSSFLDKFFSAIRITSIRKEIVILMSPDKKKIRILCIEKLIEHLM